MKKRMHTVTLTEDERNVIRVTREHKNTFCRDPRFNERVDHKGNPRKRANRNACRDFKHGGEY